jgi:hypothetical protein
MRRTALTIGAIASGLWLAAASPAAAEETTCTGTIGAETVDNLRVPPQESCTLNGTTVQGTIYVERDATLRANDVTVIGNVQAENARDVRVQLGSSIGGSVQVVQGGSARVTDSAVNGDILFDENTSALRALRNDIGGSLQAFQNTGGVTITRNFIDGNLQCKENVPAPTGGGNVVQGNKEDQCAQL